MSQRSCHLALAALAAIVVSFSAFANESLILRDEASRLTAPSIASPRLLAEEIVRVDPRVLDAAPELLQLELEPGETRLAFLTDFERTADGGLVWRGRFADGPPGYRSITLSVHGGLLHGTLEAGHVSWSLRPLADGSTRLATVTPRGEIDCAVGHADTAQPAAALPLPAASQTGVSAAADGNNLSILVLYPPDLRETWGGHVFAVAWAQHAVDSLNTAFRNSLIDAGAFLSGVREWNGISRNITQAPNAARNSPEVQAWRDEVQADLVAMLGGADSFGGCGYANLMSKGLFGPQMAPLAYSISRVGCDSFDHWVFAHEIGHNLGAQHRFGASSASRDQAVFPYAFAHEGNVTTIMGGRPSYLTYSNPLVFVDGEPAGIENDRDNARALQQTIPVAAAFRAGGTALPPAGVPAPVPPRPTITPAQPTELRAQVLSATEVRLTWKDNTDDDVGVRIEGRQLGTAYEVLAEVAKDLITHVVVDLEPATTYRFRVQAIGEEAVSGYSNEATATTEAAPPAAAPAGLTATPVSAGEVALSWSEVEHATGYEMELRGADPAADRAAAPIVLGNDGALVDGLDAATPYTFRVRAVNAAGASPWSGEASATTDAAVPAGPCTADGATLCLLDDRFAVTTAWRNPRAPFNFGTGAAKAAAGSERTGLFTFFNPANVELAVKMIDGRGVNGAFWHFFGALSDVEYWVTVRDGVDGTSRTYHNPAFELCGRGDTTAFPGAPEAPPESASSPLLAATANAEACEEGSETLCLAGGRFEVEVDWENPRIEGDAGVGRVFVGQEGELTGHFWFFRPDNLELS
ncbi:MAG TPA: fibronectin type III domain-containing protein, partial [Thermoanaerobaculia bacterium]|nr:fibronectin type III domain-containing protein [Thermoanaerobaculia bacterium]